MFPTFQLHTCKSPHTSMEQSQDGNFDLDIDLNALFETDLEDIALSSTQLMDIPIQQLPEIEAKEGRFADPLTDFDVKQQQKNAIPMKTRKSNNWAVGLWKEWAENRNTKIQTTVEPGYPIPTTIGGFDKDYSLMDYWLQRFILEIRRKDGNPYPPNTLVQITSALQRYLRTDCDINVNFYKDDDPTFAGFRKTLDARMKDLTAQGIGIKTNKSDPVTKDDEHQLWASGVFNMDTSEGLSNAVFFYNGKAFGFRGYQEHLDCQADQFEVGYDFPNGRKYIKYTQRVRKNSQGGLKHRRINIEPIIHYDQVENPVSIYKIFEKYLNLIPRCGPFYRKPLAGVDANNNARFSAGTIPQNTLRQMLKKFYEDAGISTDKRTITNHSARVSLCTTLYNDRFADKSVVSRSKHRSSAVQQYQRENFGMLNDISNALEPPLVPVKSEVKEETPARSAADNPQQLPSSVNKDNEHKNDDENLTVFVPKCVKRIIIVKDGKTISMDI